MIFSKRYRLAQLYYQWKAKYDLIFKKEGISIKDDALSTITFLSLSGLLNEQKCKEFVTIKPELFPSAEIEPYK